MVAHWVQGPLSVDKHRRRAAGAPGLAPRVPDLLRALVAPLNASGAPVVAHWVLGPLGTSSAPPPPQKRNKKGFNRGYSCSIPGLPCFLCVNR